MIRWGDAMTGLVGPFFVGDICAVRDAVTGAAKLSRYKVRLVIGVMMAAGRMSVVVVWSALYATREPDIAGYVRWRCNSGGRADAPPKTARDEREHPGPCGGVLQSR